MSRFSLLCLLLFLSLFASIFLAADEPVRVDRYGDPLPEQALARLGTIRFRQGSMIQCLAYSPDGKFLASGSNDGMIYLWEANTGKKIREFKGHQLTVYRLAFSPDGKRLVSASLINGNDGDVRLWDAATAKLLFHWPAMESPVSALAFSPDGKFIATGHHDHRVHLWDAVTGKVKRTWTGEETQYGFMSGIAMAPDGKILIAADSNGKIRFMDLQTGKQIERDLSLKGQVYSLAFSSDGTILAAAGAEGIRLYRASTMEEIHRIDGHQAAVFVLAFSLDGKTLVSGSEDSTIRFWKVDSGKQGRILPKQTGSVHVLAMSPDGKTVASANHGDGGVVHLWDLQTGTSLPPQADHRGSVDQLTFLRDGQTIVSTVCSSQVVVWPQGTGIKSQIMELPSGSKECLLCADRSTLAVTKKDGTLLLLDIATGREIARCPFDEGINVMSVSADNKLALVVDDDHAEVWDLTSKKPIHQFEPKTYCRGISPNGRWLVLDIEQRFSVWDLKSKKEICCLTGLGDCVSRLVFSPDGRMIITTGSDRCIQIWESATGKQRLLLPTEDTFIRTIVCSFDGRMLATGDEKNRVQLWNLRDGKELHTFQGRWSREKKPRVWDLRDGEDLHTFQGHFGNVEAIAFSPDSRRLVSGGDDTTALIWDIPARCRGRKPAPEHYDKEERNSLWISLADSNASVAYVALQKLAAAPADAVSLCKDRLLKPSTPPEEIQQWIAQLDHEESTVRKQASGNLERVEADAEMALENALKGHCSLELKRRIKALLETLKGKSIRVLRAVELLEQIGTPEAVDVLRRLEKETSNAVIRDDVQRSLARLAAKHKAP